MGHRKICANNPQIKSKVVLGSCHQMIGHKAILGVFQFGNVCISLSEGLGVHISYAVPIVGHMSTKRFEISVQGDTWKNLMVQGC